MLQCIVSCNAMMHINYEHLVQKILRTVRHGVPYFTRRLHTAHMKVRHCIPHFTYCVYTANRSMPQIVFHTVFFA